jgi:hypothetical protein
MRSISAVRHSYTGVYTTAALLALVGVFAASAHAQSIDLASPSPVRTNEVTGSIAARDIGDARLTDHFYAFSGAPGDVLITVESNNLNGDIDVFTALGLRPLLKFTVYAGASSPTTKSIFLRQQQDLILRVEARTPNDDEGTYRLRFGGSFVPITSGPLTAEAETPNPSPSVFPHTAKKGRRVSSAGARLPEPPAEVAAAPTPEPTPVESPASPEAKPAARTAANSSRNRRPPRRSRQPQPKKAEPVVSDTEERSGTEAAAAEPKPVPARKRPTRRTGTVRETAKAPPVVEAEDTGPRLIIETADGTFVNRSMATVRRVTVENGQVVVVGKDGKIQRVQLADVVRMSIAP